MRAERAATAGVENAVEAQATTMRHRARARGWATERRMTWLATLVLLLTTLIFFAPLLRGQTFSNVQRFQAVMEPWHDQGAPLPRQYPQTDQADTFYPWIVFAGRALRGGELPLWDPYSFGGHPFFANGETNLLYPPRLLLTWALPPSWAQDLFLFLHVWGSGLAMRLYLRRLQVGQIGAMLGAVIWMFNSFALGWLLLGHIAALMVLLPLALLLARATADTASPTLAAGMGAALGLMLLGSNILMTLVAWLIALGYYGVLLAWRCWGIWRGATRAGRGQRLTGMLVGLPILTMLVALGIGAVQLLPTIELSGQMARVPADYSRYLQGARARLTDLTSIAWPDQAPTDTLLNRRLWFIGWPPLILVPLAARRREGRWWLLALAVLVLYILGTPLTWLGAHLVPGLLYFRPLGRMLFVWALAGAIATALGWETLAGWLRHRYPLAGYRIAALGLVLTAITAGQLIAYGRTINPPFQPRTAASLYPSTPLVDRLREEGPAARVLPLRSIVGPETWAPPMFNGSVAQGLGVRIVGGYESLLPARIADYWRVVKGEDLAFIADHPVQDAVIINFYPRRVRYDLLPQIGITTIAAVPDVTPAWLAQHWPGLRVTPLYEGPDGWLYHLPDARPPIYTSYRVESVADDQAALARFAERGRESDAGDLVSAADLARIPTLPESGSCDNAPRRHQTLVKQTANTLTMHSDSPCQGLLVINQSWAPGWTARVDGQAAPVLRANYQARAVPIPAGEHRIELVYAPRSFTLGLVITVLSGFALIAGILIRRQGRGDKAHRSRVIAMA